MPRRRALALPPRIRRASEVLREAAALGWQLVEIPNGGDWAPLQEAAPLHAAARRAAACISPAVT